MIFASKEGVVFEKMVESLPVLVLGAGAGAGEKKNRRRSKTDRLRNTERECLEVQIQLVPDPQHIIIFWLVIGKKIFSF